MIDMTMINGSEEDLKYIQENKELLDSFVEKLHDARFLSGQLKFYKMQCASIDRILRHTEKLEKENAEALEKMTPEERVDFELKCAKCPL